jgi:hypothetical protein
VFRRHCGGCGAGTSEKGDLTALAKTEEREEMFLSDDDVVGNCAETRRFFPEHENSEGKIQLKGCLLACANGQLRFKAASILAMDIETIIHVGEDGYFNDHITFQTLKAIIRPTCMRGSREPTS